MIAYFFAGFVVGGITIIVAGACLNAREAKRPCADLDAFREAKRSLSARRRAIRRGIELAGPMPVGGCSDEAWN